MFKLCKILPLTGPGGDQLLTHSLQLFLLLFIYFVLSALCRICMCYVLQGYVTIHEKVKVLVQDAQAGRVSSLPPPPCSIGGAVGGGGGGWRAMFCLGILSGEGGISGK